MLADQQDMYLFKFFTYPGTTFEVFVSAQCNTSTTKSPKTSCFEFTPRPHGATDVEMKPKYKLRTRCPKGFRYSHNNSILFLALAYYKSSLLDDMGKFDSRISVKVIAMTLMICTGFY